MMYVMYALYKIFLWRDPSMRHHEMHDEDESPEIRGGRDGNALRGHLKEARNQGADINFK